MEAKTHRGRCVVASRCGVGGMEAPPVAQLPVDLNPSVIKLCSVDHLDGEIAIPDEALSHGRSYYDLVVEDVVNNEEERFLVVQLMDKPSTYPRAPASTSGTGNPDLKGMELFFINRAFASGVNDPRAALLTKASQERLLYWFSSASFKVQQDDDLHIEHIMYHGRPDNDLSEKRKGKVVSLFVHLAHYFAKQLGCNTVSVEDAAYKPLVPMPLDVYHNNLIRMTPWNLYQGKPGFYNQFGFKFMDQQVEEQCTKMINKITQSATAKEKEEITKMNADIQNAYASFEAELGVLESDTVEARAKHADAYTMQYEMEAAIIGLAHTINEKVHRNVRNLFEYIAGEYSWINQELNKLYSDSFEYSGSPDRDAAESIDWGPSVKELVDFTCDGNPWQPDSKHWKDWKIRSVTIYIPQQFAAKRKREVVTVAAKQMPLRSQGEQAGPLGLMLLSLSLSPSGSSSPSVHPIDSSSLASPTRQSKGKGLNANPASDQALREIGITLSYAKLLTQLSQLHKSDAPDVTQRIVNDDNAYLSRHYKNRRIAATRAALKCIAKEKTSKTENRLHGNMEKATSLMGEIDAMNQVELLKSLEEGTSEDWITENVDDTTARDALNAALAAYNVGTVDVDAAKRWRKQQIELRGYEAKMWLQEKEAREKAIQCIQNELDKNDTVEMRRSRLGKAVKALQEKANADTRIHSDVMTLIVSAKTEYEQSLAS